MTLKTFDADKNDILDGFEFTNWRGATTKMVLEMNLQPTPRYVDDLKQAWVASQIDDDSLTGTRYEVAVFLLRTWNLLIPQ